MVPARLGALPLPDGTTAAVTFQDMVDGTEGMLEFHLPPPGAAVEGSGSSGAATKRMRLKVDFPVHAWVTLVSRRCQLRTREWQQESLLMGRGVPLLHPPAALLLDEQLCHAPAAAFPAARWQARQMTNRAGLQELMRSRADEQQCRKELDNRDRYVTPMRPFQRVSWCEFYDQVSAGPAAGGAQGCP